MNLVPVKVVSSATGASLQSGDAWSYELSPENARKALRSTSGEVVLGARHSTIRLHKEERPQTILGRIYTVEPTGDITYAHVDLGSSIIVVSVPPDVRLAADDHVWIEFDQQKLHLFDATTQQALVAG